MNQVNGCCQISLDYSIAELSYDYHKNRVSFRMGQEA